MSIEDDPIIGDESSRSDPVTSDKVAAKVELPSTWIGRQLNRPIETYESGRAYLTLAEQNRSGRRGITEELFDPEAKDVPWVGAISEIPYMLGLAGTARKMTRNEPVDDESLIQLNHYLEFQKRKENASIGSKVIDTIQMSLGMGAEIASALALSGIFVGEGVAAGTAARVAATRGARLAVARLVNRTLGTAAGNIANTVMKSAVRGDFLHRVLGEALDKSVSSTFTRVMGARAGNYATKILKAGVDLESRGLVGALLNPQWIARQAAERRLNDALNQGDESVAGSIAKAFLDVNIEIGSEFSGAYLGKAAKKLLPPALVKKMGEATLFKWIAKRANTSSAKAAWGALNAMGIHGALEEMGEERVGGFLKGLFGVEGPGGLLSALKGAWPSGEQFATEAIAFSVLPIMANGMNRVGGAASFSEQARAKELFQKIARRDEAIAAKTPEQLHAESVDLDSRLEEESKFWFSDTPFKFLEKIFGETRTGPIQSMLTEAGVANLRKVRDLAIKAHPNTPDAGINAISTYLANLQKLHTEGIKTEADVEQFHAGVKSGDIRYHPGAEKYYITKTAMTPDQVKEFAQKTGIATIEPISEHDMRSRYGEVLADALVKPWDELSMDEREPYRLRWHDSDYNSLKKKYEFLRAVMPLSRTHVFEGGAVVHTGSAAEIQTETGYVVPENAPVFSTDTDGNNIYAFAAPAVTSADGTEVDFAFNADRGDMTEDIIEAHWKQHSGLQLNEAVNSWLDDRAAELEGKQDKTPEEKKHLKMLTTEKGRFEYAVKSYYANTLGYKHDQKIGRRMREFDQTIPASVNEAFSQIVGEPLLKAMANEGFAENVPTVEDLSAALAGDLNDSDVQNEIRGIIADMDGAGVTASMQMEAQNAFNDLKAAVETNDWQKVMRASKHYWLVKPKEPTPKEHVEPADRQVNVVREGKKTFTGAEPRHAEESREGRELNMYGTSERLDRFDQKYDDIFPAVHSEKELRGVMPKWMAEAEAVAIARNVESPVDRWLDQMETIDPAEIVQMALDLGVTSPLGARTRPVDAAPLDEAIAAARRELDVQENALAGSTDPFDVSVYMAGVKQAQQKLLEAKQRRSLATSLTVTELDSPQRAIENMTRQLKTATWRLVGESKRYKTAQNRMTMPRDRTRAGQSLPAVQTSTAIPLTPDEIQATVTLGSNEVDKETRDAIDAQFGEETTAPARQPKKNLMRRKEPPRNPVHLAPLDSRPIEKQLELVVWGPGQSAARVGSYVAYGYANIKTADLSEIPRIEPKADYPKGSGGRRLMTVVHPKTGKLHEVMAYKSWDAWLNHVGKEMLPSRRVEGVAHLNKLRRGIEDPKLDIQGVIGVVDYGANTAAYELGLPVERVIHDAVNGVFPGGRVRREWNKTPTEGAIDAEGNVQKASPSKRYTLSRTINADDVLSETDTEPVRRDFLSPAPAENLQVYRAAVLPITTERLMATIATDQNREEADRNRIQLEQEVHDFMVKNRIRRVMIVGADQIAPDGSYTFTNDQGERITMPKFKVVPAAWERQLGLVLKHAFNMQTRTRAVEAGDKANVEISPETAKAIEDAIKGNAGKPVTAEPIVSTGEAEAQDYANMLGKVQAGVREAIEQTRQQQANAKATEGQMTWSMEPERIDVRNIRYIGIVEDGVVNMRGISSYSDTALHELEFGGEARSLDRFRVYQSTQDPKRAIVSWTTQPNREAQDRVTAELMDLKWKAVNHRQKYASANIPTWSLQLEDRILSGVKRFNNNRRLSESENRIYRNWIRKAIRREGDGMRWLWKNLGAADREAFKGFLPAEYEDRGQTYSLQSDDQVIGWYDAENDIVRSDVVKRSSSVEHSWYTHATSFYDRWRYFPDTNTVNFWETPSDDGEAFAATVNYLERRYGVRNPKVTIAGELYTGEIKSLPSDTYSMIPESYKGIPVVRRSGMVNAVTGLPLGARRTTDAEGNQIIEVDPEVLAQNFADKQWTAPRTPGVEALPADAFKTMGEWMNFVLEHEYQHTQIPRAPGQALAEYEDRGQTFSLVPESEIPAEYRTRVAAGGLVYGQYVHGPDIVRTLWGNRETVYTTNHADLFGRGVFQDGFTYNPKTGRVDWWEGANQVDETIVESVTDHLLEMGFKTIRHGTVGDERTWSMIATANEQMTRSMQLVEGIYSDLAPQYKAGAPGFHRMMLDIMRDVRSTQFERTAEIAQMRQKLGMDDPKKYGADHAARVNDALTAVGAVLDGSRKIPIGWTAEGEIEWDPEVPAQKAARWNTYAAAHGLPSFDQLTTDMRARYDQARDRYNSVVRDFSDEEWIRYLDDYLPHLYRFRSDADKEKFINYLREESNRSKPRVFESYETAANISHILPRTMNALDLYDIYNQTILTAAKNKALANTAALIQDLDGAPIVIPVKLNRRPGSDQLISDQTLDETVKHLAEYLGVKYDPSKDASEEITRLTSTMDLAKHDYERMDSPLTKSVDYFIVRKGATSNLMKMVLNYGRMDNKFFNAIEHFNAWSKFLMLSASAFHPFALLEAFSAHTFGFTRKTPWASPIKTYQKYRSVLEEMRTNPARFTPWIRRGLVIPTTSPDVQMGIIQKDITRWMDHWTAKDNFTTTVMMPGLKALQWYKSKVDKWLWSEVHPALKLMSAEFVMAEWQGQHPTATSAEVEETGRQIAQYLNQGFGGQDWMEYAWATPKVMQWLHLLVFAPDWTFSAANISALTRLPVLNRLHTTNLSPLARKEMLTRFWPAYAGITLIAVPNLVQLMIYALFGDPDEKDVPFNFMNEVGRETYIDFTPMFRHLPLYDGGPSGKRRTFMRWGKAAYEISEGWLEDPAMVLRKSSSIVRQAFEQVTGSTVTGWELPFKGEGMLGIINAGGSVADSRLGNVAKMFMPITLQSIAKGEFASFIAPGARGLSQGGATKAMEQLLEAYVNKASLPKGMQKVDLQVAVGDILESARRNGLNADMAFKAAKGSVAGKYYKAFFEAMNKNSESGMESAAEKVLLLGNGMKQINSSMRSRSKAVGKEFTPEMAQAVKDAIDRAKLRE